MVELSNQPYTIKMTGDVIPSEVELRHYIDLSWCNGVIFNAAVVEHGQRLLEYDAVLWDDAGEWGLCLMPSLHRLF